MINFTFFLILCLFLTAISCQSTELRADKLNGYDIMAIPPLVTVNGTVDQIVEVGLGMNFYQIIGIDSTIGTLEFAVWMRLSWIDPRLAWNPADYGGIDTTYYGASVDSLQTELWVPQVELWNAKSSIFNTIIDKTARVTSDGRVYWSRPGSIEALCNFEDIAQFPFDSLSCTLEFGPWVETNDFMQLVPLDPVVNLQGTVAGGSEFEYSVANITYAENTYEEFPCCPDQPWTTMLFTLDLNRASAWYVRKLIWPQILLCIVAFTVFWMDPSSGERLGLGVTIVLTGLAIDLLVADLLPISGISIWISSFSTVLFAFTLFSLFESCVVIYFYFLPTKSMKPLGLRDVFCTWKKTKVEIEKEHEMEELRKQQKKEAKKAKKSASKEALNDEGKKKKKKKIPEPEPEPEFPWRWAAFRLDYVCRYLVPLAFVISIIVLFSQVW